MNSDKRDRQDPRGGGFTLKQALAGVLVVSAVAFAVYCCIELFKPRPGDSTRSPMKRISLDSAPGSPGTPKPDGGAIGYLRVAVAPVISPETSLVMYSPLVKELGRKLKMNAILLQRQSYAEVNNLVRHGGCEIAFVCTYPFVQGERDFGLKLLVAPVVGGRQTYQSYIIVPAGSKASSLLDFRNKRFGSPSLLSNSGWLYPATLLLKRGENPKRFFQEHVLTGSHDASVHAVATSFVDGAAVDSIVYDQMVEKEPSLGTKTRIIIRSPDFGMPPVVASPSLDAALRERIVNAFLHLHEIPEGRDALSKVRIDRFVVPDDALYDSVREAAKLWEAKR